MIKMIFKRFIFSVVCLSIVSCGSATIGPELVATENKVVLVQDVPAAETTPRNFRTTDIIYDFLEKERSAISTKGLVDLRASGSAEFSEKALLWLNQRLGEDLIIVDLRQESHGFINGAAVTWYAKNNWLNLGKLHDQALQDEASRLNALAQDKVVRIYDGNGVKHEIKDFGKSIEIRQVCSEQQLTAQYNIRYFRLTVPDHMRPSDEEADRFVAFVRNLSGRDWLHFHCRAGMGRTTTFLVMYDMMRNADKVSLDDIIARHAAVEPNYNLFKTREGSREEIYKDRIDFVRLFYEYSKAFCAGDKASWSEWLKKVERDVHSWAGE
ncbi:MAG: hypothetical protein MUC39_03200 [Candidatus Omnitrophica bacterium]|nr:hypothetical protein [Candidatus Omnitrophota bacterium]